MTPAERQRRRRALMSPSEKDSMMASTVPLRRPDPPPLPATLQEWDAARKLKAQRTINEIVEDAHRRMLVDPERREHYNKLMLAIYDEQAVERKLVFDDSEMASMMRQKARDEGDDPDLANESIGAIVQALRVVLRRYGQGRKQRAEMVGQVRVPSEPPRGNSDYYDESNGGNE